MRNRDLIKAARDLRTGRRGSESSDVIVMNAAAPTT